MGTFTYALSDQKVSGTYQEELLINDIFKKELTFRFFFCFKMFLSVFIVFCVQSPGR